MSSATAVPPWASTKPYVPAPSEPASPSFAFGELQASLEVFSREMIGQGAPAVLIEARAGQYVWTHAVGVRRLDGGEPAKPGDVMAAGGVLRSMLAVSTLKLVEEGQLVLDAPVGAYLPENPSPAQDAPSAAERSISLRQLLADASGRDSTRRADTLLGLVLERVSGVPLAEVLRSDIWNPVRLGSTFMRTASPQPAADAIPDVVHGYISVQGRSVDITEALLESGPVPPRLFASPADINSFYAALFGGRLLSAPSLLLMKGTVSAGYGLGLDQWDDRCTNGNYYGHAGDVPGYGVIAMSSADGNRQLAITVAYPPEPVGRQPSAIALELTSLAQVVLNGSCRFRFG